MPTGKGNREKRVFLVHGHDQALTEELQMFLSRELDLHPVVLEEVPAMGRTIIEKFEANSKVGFAFVLLTPDDLAHTLRDLQNPSDGYTGEFRARQNVIFEAGFFAAKLERRNVCWIRKGPAKLPSDLEGLGQQRIRKSLDEIKPAIIKELLRAGFSLPKPARDDYLPEDYVVEPGTREFGPSPAEPSVEVEPVAELNSERARTAETQDRTFCVTNLTDGEGLLTGPNIREGVRVGDAWQFHASRVGFAVYGPYLPKPLEPGDYTATFSLSVNGIPRDNRPILAIDVVSAVPDAGGKLLALRVLTASDFGEEGIPQGFRLRFDVYAPEPKLEFRVRALSTGFTSTLQYVRLSRRD